MTCRFCFILAALLLLSDVAPARPASAPPAPSVAVTTVTAQRGQVPRRLTAYGVMQPEPGGSATLSLLRAGRVARVLVLPGAAVTRGQAMVTIMADPASLAAYQQARTALVLARSERVHTAQLLAQHFATKDQLAASDKAVSDAQSALAALQATGGGAPAQSLLAPFDGVVATVLVTPGTNIAAATPLVTLDRADALVASVGVEPGDRPLIDAGEPATLAPLDSAGVSLPAAVVAASGILDPTTRLVQVLVMPRSGAALLSGSPVAATIIVGAYRGWLVPRDAVVTDGSAHVFQVRGGHAVQVAVAVVGTDDGTTVVDGPLDAEAPVVTTGAAQLQDGMAVRSATPTQ